MNKNNNIFLGVILTLIVVGLACYLILQQGKVENSPNVYTDEFLSFEYPDNVQLVFSKPLGGRSDSQGIEFLVHDPEKDVYNPTGLRLSYLVSLGEGEGSDFVDLDDIKDFYQPYNLETQTLDVDDRQALQVVTGDMTGETFFISIPANESGDAYRFNGSFMGGTVEEILSVFMSTADLKY